MFFLGRSERVVFVFSSLVPHQLSTLRVGFDLTVFFLILRV
jgi:hypothetical protein